MIIKNYDQSLPNNTKVFKKILTIIAVIVIITLIGYVISTTEPEYSKDNCKKYKISLSNWVGSEYYECDSIIKDDNTFYLYNDNNDKYFLMFTVGKGVTVRVYSNNCK